MAEKTEAKRPLLHRAREAAAQRRELAAKTATASRTNRVAPLKPATTASVAASKAPLPPSAPGKATQTPAGTLVEFADSTNVRSALLGADGQVAVTFANGAGASFGGFTPELLEAWRTAPSAGRWFSENIRANVAGFPPLSKTPAPTVVPASPAPVGPPPGLSQPGSSQPGAKAKK